MTITASTHLPLDALSLQARCDWLEWSLDQSAAETHKFERKVNDLTKRLVDLRAKTQSHGGKSRRSATEEIPFAGLFVDEDEQFRFEVQLAWARRIPAPDKAAFPLGAYSMGPHFLTSLDKLEGIQRSKVVDVVVEIVTGLVERLPARQLHALKDAGGRPVTRPGDRATAWRASLQQCTPGARRLHFYRNADVIELSRVGAHDDFRP